MPETYNGGSNQWSGGSLNGNRNSNGLDNEDSDKRITPFDRLSQDLSNDPRILKEITLGKRIGFYRLRGELGSGNFSQVKLGIHALTKGMALFFICPKGRITLYPWLSVSPPTCLLAISCVRNSYSFHQNFLTLATVNLHDV